MIVCYYKLFTVKDKIFCTFFVLLAYGEAARSTLPYGKSVNTACNCTCLKGAKEWWGEQQLTN